MRQRQPTVYIAARYGRLEEGRETAAVFRRNGFTVTASWLEGGDESLYSEDQYPDTAQQDLDDILRAEYFVFLSEEPENPHGRGGRHVEYGYALANGKRLIGIGPRENIFHHLPHVAFTDTAEEAALKIIQRERRPR